MARARTSRWPRNSAFRRPPEHADGQRAEGHAPGQPAAALGRRARAGGGGGVGCATCRSGDGFARRGRWDAGRERGGAGAWGAPLAEVERDSPGVGARPPTTPPAATTRVQRPRQPAAKKPVAAVAPPAAEPWPPAEGFWEPPALDE